MKYNTLRLWIHHNQLKFFIFTTVFFMLNALLGAVLGSLEYCASVLEIYVFFVTQYKDYKRDCELERTGKAPSMNNDLYFCKHPDRLFYLCMPVLLFLCALVWYISDTKEIVVCMLVGCLCLVGVYLKTLQLINEGNNNKCNDKYY